MHSLLEEYLEEVAGRLESLPVKRQNEELREMRQHLLNAVIVNRELGQTEDEAARSAMDQFGSPTLLGNNLVWAWRREQARDRRNLWLAILSTPILASVLLFLSPYAATSLLKLVWPPYSAFFEHHMNVCRGVAHSLFFFAYGLTGATLGAVVPKQAVRGAWLGMAVYEAGYLIWLGRPLIVKLGAMPYYAEDLAWALTGVFCAWAVSRWQAGAGERAWRRERARQA